MPTSLTKSSTFTNQTYLLNGLELYEDQKHIKKIKLKKKLKFVYEQNHEGT